MASLTLKGIPDDLLCALRAAAEGDRRSLNQEVLHLLTAALRGRSEDSGRDPEIEAQLAAWRRLAGRWESDLDPAQEGQALIGRRSRGRKVDL